MWVALTALISVSRPGVSEIKSISITALAEVATGRVPVLHALAVRALVATLLGAFVVVVRSVLAWGLNASNDAAPNR